MSTLTPTPPLPDRYTQQNTELECSITYWNLATGRKTHMVDLAPFYTREVFATAGCDTVGRDLSGLRAAYQAALGEQRSLRILDFSYSESDALKAKQTMEDLHGQTVRQATVALPVWRWPQIAFIRGSHLLMNAYEFLLGGPGGL
tara:strand:- start:120 stop:554 length:435 start_codon:yes stop_codon:yes gene_type:complete